MAREIPEVVRAAAGLAATVLDEARKLPSNLTSLPVRVIGVAMTQVMKVQQSYAGLVARGDELLVGLRGEAEPGLATFDEDEESGAPIAGFRGSAFDRAPSDAISDEEVAELPADPAADAVVAAIDDLTRGLVEDLDDAATGLADGTDATAGSLEDVPADTPSTDEVLDELAIDEAVPEVADTDPLTPDDVAADGATPVDILTPDGSIETVDAAVTDEGIAAVEAPQDQTPQDGAGTDETVATTDAAAGPAESSDAETGAATDTTDTAATDTAATDTNAGPDVAVDEGGTPVAAATGVRTDVGESDTAEVDAAMAEGASVDAVGEASDVPTDDPQGGSDISGAQAAGATPVDGYDSFTIAQLRGRLRGYQLNTVADLLAYEEATRAREPYLRMLRNRLEKLEEQAVESSPLAPRGAQ